MKRHWLSKIQIVIGFLLGIGTITAYQFSAPVILFPQAKNWEITKEYVSAEIEGYKIRDCSIVSGSSSGYVIKNNVVNEVPISFESTGKKKPASYVYKINFSRWFWHYDHIASNPPVKSVLLSVKYECNGRVMIQQVGPFELPKSI